MTPDIPLLPLVLVVDDYADAREMYSQYLKFSGFRVAQASDGAQALEQAFLLLPDVILMDMSLPVMDGWEATSRLKADTRTRHIPVVALTGHADTQRTDTYDAFLLKPCPPDDMVQQIRRVLSKAQPPRS